MHDRTPNRANRRRSSGHSAMESRRHLLVRDSTPITRRAVRLAPLMRAVFGCRRAYGRARSSARQVVDDLTAKPSERRAMKEALLIRAAGRRSERLESSVRALEQSLATGRCANPAAAIYRLDASWARGGGPAAVLAVERLPRTPNAPPEAPLQLHPFPPSSGQRVAETFYTRAEGNTAVRALSDPPQQAVVVPFEGSTSTARAWDLPGQEVLEGIAPVLVRSSRAARRVVLANWRSRRDAHPRACASRARGRLCSATAGT